MNDIEEVPVSVIAPMFGWPKRYDVPRRPRRNAVIIRKPLVIEYEEETKENN